MFSQMNDDSFVCACCGESKRAKKRRCIGGVAIAEAICLYKGFVNHLNGPFPLPAAGETGRYDEQENADSDTGSGRGLSLIHI